MSARALKRARSAGSEDRAFLASPAPVAFGEESTALAPEVLFEGGPTIVGGIAVLWDASAQEERWPAAVRFTRLGLRFPDGAPDADALDPGLALVLFVEDMAAPRARVTVADLLRQGGERPLNLRRLPGQAVRLLLQDPNGAWRERPPRFVVTLAVE
jgi:hypothetical protein